jgi:hypothetical protein
MMADETKIDASQLVGGSSNDGPAPSSPPHVDPAVALDPTKSAPPPAKAAKVKRPAAKKRRAATEVAKAARSVVRKARNAVTKAALSNSTASSAECRAAYDAAKVNQVASFAEVPDAEEFQLRFAADGSLLEGVITVEREHLTPHGGGRVTYGGVVNFNGAEAPARVTEAWLIAPGGEAVCCDLGLGLAVGGGHQAQIPANHLLF